MQNPICHYYLKNINTVKNMTGTYEGRTIDLAALHVENTYNFI